VGFFIEDDWTLGPLVLTAGGRADRWAITQGHYQELNAAGTVTSSSVNDPTVAARRAGRAVGALARC
jgi:hypothetical protein